MRGESRGVEATEGKPERSAGDSRARFHGIEVTSDRVVFVIDISGSMREKLAGDAKGRTRWEAVRDELAATLEGPARDSGGEVASR